MRRTSKFSRGLIAAVAVGALSAPGTAAAQTDVRNPDSKAAAIEARGHALTTVDLRSADARAAAVDPRPAAQRYVDLRSADAKAAATDNARAASSRPTGFDPNAVVIAAGSALALILALSGTVVLVRRRGRAPLATG